MYHKVNGNIVLTVSIIAIMLVSSAGLCLAYFTQVSNNVMNTFNLGTISCDIEEDFNGSIKKDVVVKNTGKMPVFIRSNIVVYWLSEDGKSIHADEPQQDVDYTISVDDTNWFQCSDGYYYYKNLVPVDGETDVLISEAKLKEGVSAPEGYNLVVEVVSTAIQCNPDRAVKDAWKVVEIDGDVLVKVK